MKVSILSKSTDSDKASKGSPRKVESGEGRQPRIEIESWRSEPVLSVRLEDYSERRGVYGEVFHREAHVEFTQSEFVDMVAKAIKAGFLEPQHANVVEKIESHLTAAVEQLQLLKGKAIPKN